MPLRATGSTAHARRAASSGRPHGSTPRGPDESQRDGSPGDRPRVREPPIVSVVTTPDPITFLIAVALAAAISTGVFVHATKHGSRHATAWGVAAFLAAGVAVPVYFIRYWARR